MTVSLVGSLPLNEPTRPSPSSSANCLESRYRRGLILILTDMAEDMKTGQPRRRGWRRNG